MLSFLFSSKRFKPIELNTMFEPCFSHLECFERDKKRYQGQKTISGTKDDIRDKTRYQSDIPPPFHNPSILDQHPPSQLSHEKTMSLKLAPELQTQTFPFPYSLGPVYEFVCISTVLG